MLENLYLIKKMSVVDIAKKYNCSENKINYWFKKYKIPKRSISEAVYLKHNPKGDPFKIKEPENLHEAELKGLGLGIFWGEGNKSDKYAIRVGNTDPYLIKKFMEFLIRIYGVKKTDLKFGLQIFSDMNPKDALQIWINYLKVNEDQFQKIIVTPARSLGTYRKKTKHGVLTIYYNNKKLRGVIKNDLNKFGYNE